jgi:hypothetical protein
MKMNMLQLHRTGNIKRCLKFPLPVRGVLILVFLQLYSISVYGQELEPRALTNVPVGMNFAAVGYGFSRGNILLDPAVPIEDLTSHVHAFVGAYVRAINLFGHSGKIDVVVPFAAGDWEGLWEGEAAARKIDGFGDPRVRLSVNFAGAPALRGSEFRSYQQKTIVGVNIQVIVPVGQYDPSRLINLSSNRWTFRPQIGMSHRRGKWFVESYLGAWFFTTNRDFFGGQKLTQRPLFVGKLHLIRTLTKRGIWGAIGVGYGIGGRTSLDDVPKDTRISTFRFGAALAVPIGIQHSLKFVLDSGVRLERGPDFDAIGVSYQYRWGGGG